MFHCPFNIHSFQFKALCDLLDCYHVSVVHICISTKLWCRSRFFSFLSSLSIQSCLWSCLFSSPFKISLSLSFHSKLSMMYKTGGTYVPCCRSRFFRSPFNISLSLSFHSKLNMMCKTGMTNWNWYHFKVIPPAMLQIWFLQQSIQHSSLQFKASYDLMVTGDIWSAVWRTSFWKIKRKHLSIQSSLLLCPRPVHCSVPAMFWSSM